MDLYEGVTKLRRAGGGRNRHDGVLGNAVELVIRAIAA